MGDSVRSPKSAVNSSLNLFSLLSVSPIESDRDVSFPAHAYAGTLECMGWPRVRLEVVSYFARVRHSTVERDGPTIPDIRLLRYRCHNGRSLNSGHCVADHFRTPACSIFRDAKHP